jgi:hypothetical protein
MLDEDLKSKGLGIDSKTGEEVAITRDVPEWNPPETEGMAEIEPGTEAQKGTSENVDVKRKYRYPTILVRLNREREAKLKEACQVIGLDPSRVDDHQAEVVWEIVEWVVPLMKMRGALMELFGPILNETPERERKRV